MQAPLSRKGDKLVFAYLTAALLAACSGTEPLEPRLAEASINGRANKVTITGSQVRWNDKRVSDRQLAQLLAKSQTIDPKPELQFQSDGSTTYDALARVLQIIKDSKAANFGFVGNEAYSPSDSPTG